MNWDDSDRFTYRSERYDGCSMFHNAKYCDAITERIAGLKDGSLLPGR